MRMTPSFIGGSEIEDLLVFRGRIRLRPVAKSSRVAFNLKDIPGVWTRCISIRKLRIHKESCEIYKSSVDVGVFVDFNGIGVEILLDQNMLKIINVS